MASAKLIATLLIVVVIAGIGGYAWYLQSQPKVLTIRIGYQPSTHQVAEFIISAKGWLVEEAKKLGYDLKVEEYLYPSGPPEMEAFMAGRLDVVYVGAAPVVNEVGQAKGKGAPLAKIVAAVNTQGSALVVRKDFNYAGPESLKGATIGTFPPGSIQDAVLKNWLTSNGLTFGAPGEGKDVTIIAGGPSELVEALEAGTVDAIFVPSPAPEICELRGIGRSVVNSYEMMPGHACCVLAISDKFIKEHRELAKLIVKLHIKAQKFIKENLDETIEVAAQRLSKDWGYDLNFTRTVVEKAYKENPTALEFPWNPHEIVDSVLKYAEIQYKLKYIPIQLTSDDLFDLNLYDEAVAEMK